MSPQSPRCALTWSVSVPDRGYQEPEFVTLPTVSAIYAPMPPPKQTTVFATKPGQFTCHQCGNVYRWKRNLRQHLKMECGKEPSFLCPHCPHRSHYRSHLRRHLISKHDVKLP